MSDGAGARAIASDREYAAMIFLKADSRADPHQPLLAGSEGLLWPTSRPAKNEGNRQIIGLSGRLRFAYSVSRSIDARVRF
jgi:hypothetical protein